MRKVKFLLTVIALLGAVTAKAAYGRPLQPLAGAYAVAFRTVAGNCGNNGLVFGQLYYAGPGQTGSEAIHLGSAGPGSVFVAYLSRAPMAGETHWRGRMKWILSPGSSPIMTHFEGDFTFFDSRVFFLRLRYKMPKVGGGFCTMTTENTAVWTGS